jgi:hypothetical protein
MRPAPAAIELRLREGAQLFNTLDPFPFRERDLSADAERFIIEWAQELPKDRPIEILVHLQSDTGEVERAGDLSSAITGWFEARAQAESRALRELFRDGRIGFLIGIGVLSLCLLLSWSISRRFEEPFARVISESFVIIGWVVMWRPAEIFLYDWLPLVRRRKLYRRLAEAIIAVRGADDGSGSPGRDDAASRKRQPGS